MGVHENMKPYTPSSAGEEGLWLGIQSGWKRQCPVSDCLLGHLPQWEAEASGASVALPGPSLSVTPGSCLPVAAEDQSSPWQRALHLHRFSRERKVNGFPRVFHCLEITSIKSPVSQKMHILGCLSLLLLIDMYAVCRWLCMYVCMHVHILLAFYCCHYCWPTWK